MNQAATEDTKHLLNQVEEIIERSDSSRDQKLQEICEVLSSEELAFDWVGFLYG